MVSIISCKHNKFYEKFESIRKIINENGEIQSHVLYSLLIFNYYESYGYGINNGINIQVPEVIRYKEEIGKDLREILSEFSLVGIENCSIESNGGEDEVDYTIKLGLDLAKIIVFK